jgi:hypothetical protein
MTRWFKVLVVSGLVAATGTWLLLRTPRAASIHEGSSHDFWYTACGVALDSQDRYSSGGIYPPREGWFISYIQGYHQEFIYRVPEPEAMANFPAVLKALEARCQGPPTNSVEKGYVAWKHAGGKSDDAIGLLAALRAACHERAREPEVDILDYVLAGEAEFDQRWERAKHYWLTTLFEFLGYSIDSTTYYGL